MKLPHFEIVIRYIACFVLGGIVGVFDTPPFSNLKRGLGDTITLVSELQQTRAKILSPTVYEGTGLVAYLQDKVQPGYTLIQGILPGGPQVRLIDSNGEEVHRWTVNFFDIWENPTHIVPARNVPKSEFNYHTQGFWPLADGSLVVNIGDIGAVRLDLCSEIIWKLDHMAHHSITATSDGKYWIPGHISVFETPKDLLPRFYSAERIERQLIGNLKNFNNTIMLVNSDGVVEKEFSVLQAIKYAGLEHALYSSLQEIPADPTHVNDIEVVTAPLAAKIEGVSEGDLLVSARDMHMLLIMDQTDGHLKWYKQGPWVKQHDPDVMEDGTIEIFNNRSAAVGTWVNGSQIVSYDPSTDMTSVLNPVGKDDYFDSHIMGTHQKLENGNRLIVESTAGRAFEVTPEGEIVWDYRLPYDEETTSLFEAGMRVPLDYFDIENWTCEGT